MQLPWLDDGDVRVWLGDAVESLRAMPAGAAQTCVTSPPFWGLRDYGCEGQIGREESPDEWVARLVDVFREVRRVLRDDGTLWLEVGDSYANAPASGTGTAGQWNGSSPLGSRDLSIDGVKPRRILNGLKPKDLVGAPWLLAFALRADGWFLRSDIVWARPNPMPESVTDRPTKSHSFVFLLTKRARYFYDADAVREAVTSEASIARNRSTPRQIAGAGARQPGSTGPLVREFDCQTEAGRNARSVWNIATEPTPFAHFATFPQELVRRCILAGTSERGACPACGAPWARQVERGDLVPTAASYDKRAYAPPVGADAGAQGPNRARDGHRAKMAYENRTTGWAPTCFCASQGTPLVYPDPIPCIVLDPFMGSGTTALVARHHGRHAIGCELNEGYLEIAARRLQQLSLLAPA